MIVDYISMHALKRWDGVVENWTQGGLESVCEEVITELVAVCELVS
jgi:hypothetical protein